MQLMDAFDVSEWCRRSLGASVAEELFEAGFLSAVCGVRLDDGRSVVVKIRPYEPRLGPCLRVQRRVADAGFPCPAPMTGLAVRGRLAVHAESYMPGGAQLDPAHGAAPFAVLLARLVQLTRGTVPPSQLQPAPPWCAWDHAGNGVWPDRDDHGRNLNEMSGPPWVDRYAAAVRERLRHTRLRPVIGHGDWESQNLRWIENRPHAVHDWDSVIAQPDVAVAGLASSIWAARGGSGEASTVAQSAEFLAAYVEASDREWTPEEHALAWTAGLWVRLFNAKKDAADGGGPQLDRLHTEVAERVELAHLNVR